MTVALVLGQKKHHCSLPLFFFVGTGGKGAVGEVLSPPLHYQADTKPFCASGPSSHLVSPRPPPPSRRWNQVVLERGGGGWVGGGSSVVSFKLPFPSLQQWLRSPVPGWFD